MPSDTSTEITFAGQKLVLDAEGALYWPAEKMLIVSDLHLEKGSFLAQFGAGLPRYDTRATLHKLAHLIERYAPQQLVCLGDSFHDRKAFLRLTDEDRAELLRLIALIPAWHWVLGNHDPALALGLPGQQHAAYELSGLVLLHEPEKTDMPQIVGHFHPKLSVPVGGHRAHGPAFVHDGKLLIMPAFGSYTGGLSVRHEAIQSLVELPTYHMLYRNKIWKFSASSNR